MGDCDRADVRPSAGRGKLEGGGLFSKWWPVMQAMCDTTPGARHAVLPGATHISVVSNPGAYTDALLGFMARL